MAAVDWGSVPVWIGTVTASVSAVLAAVSYRRSVQDQQRGQASRVAAWISDVGDPRLQMVRDGEVAVVASVHVRVANRSDAPIYNVALHLPWHPTRLTLSELPAGAVARARVLAGEDRPQWRVAPGQTLDVQPPPQMFEVGEPDLVFTDALGRSWQRTADHRLLKVRSSSQKLVVQMANFTVSMSRAEEPCTSKESGRSEES